MAGTLSDFMSALRPMVAFNLTFWLRVTNTCEGWARYGSLTA
jgi:hypothetical protein